MVARRRATVGRTYKPSGGWSGLTVGSTAVAANTKVLMASFAPQIGLTLTVRRIRISALYSSDQNAASETTLGALGVGVFSDTAIALGIGSLPDPITDVGDDVWMLFQGMHTRISFVSGGGLVEPAGTLYEIDSKAMRKLPNGKSLAVIVGNESSSFGALLQVTIRIYTTLARA